jgi:hypothetical protein
LEPLARNAAARCHLDDVHRRIQDYSCPQARVEVRTDGTRPSRWPPL